MASVSETSIVESDITEGVDVQIQLIDSVDFIGSALDEAIIGNDADNIISARAGDDVVAGGEGGDTLKGGRGDDTLDGEAGDDEVSGGRGDDVVYGGEGADVVRGGRGDDMVFGGVGDDELFGGRGDDVVHGGEGNDVMRGGRGEDSFAFSRGESDGADAILDFRLRDDEFTLNVDGENGGFGAIASDEVAFQNVARVDADPTDELGANEDVNAGLEAVDADANVYVVQGIWNNAGQARDALVAAGAGADPLVEDDGFFFVYYNVNLDVNRLFYAGDDGALAQVANLGEAGQFAEGVNDQQAIRQLARFEEDNFSFDFDDAFAV